VLGSGGLLGSELVKLLPDSVGVTRTQLSVTDLPAMNGAMSHYAPEVVFNCAAYNAVDSAETEEEAAYQANAQGAFNVALACAKNEVRLIHFSTNFVFSGTLDRPYLETDEPGPLGVYAKSKLEGEKLMSMVMPHALIIRTAAIFGGDGTQQRVSFPQRIVERARSGQRLRVVSDQTVNPTYAADLARAAIELASADLDGVVHVVNAGCSTWHEFALATLEAFGVAGEIEGVSSADLGAPAPRPPNGCLESSRTQAMRPWREGLAAWAEKRKASSAPSP